MDKWKLAGVSVLVVNLFIVIWLYQSRQEKTKTGLHGFPMWFLWLRHIIKGLRIIVLLLQACLLEIYLFCKIWSEAPHSHWIWEINTYFYFTFDSLYSQENKNYMTRFVKHFHFIIYYYIVVIILLVHQKLEITQNNIVSL